MNKKEIIILAAIGAGVYILSQVKAMKTHIAPQYAKTAPQKAAPKRIGQPTTWLEYIAALRKAAAQRAWIERARKIRIRKAAAKKIGKKIGKTVAQKVVQKKTGQPTTQAVYIAAQRKAAPWKAPYKFPKSNFRVITPSDKLRNLAKKDIARKKAVQQKKVQKTTPSTPSARRKKRLEALYGSHWHDIWVQRQRR